MGVFQNFIYDTSSALSLALGLSADPLGHPTTQETSAEDEYHQTEEDHLEEVAGWRRLYVTHQLSHVLGWRQLGGGWKG